MQHLLKSSSALLCLLTIASCSNDNNNASTTTDATKDVTPPAVVSTNPVAAATGIARNSSVTASFSEDIFATTVDASSFTLTSSAGAVAGAVTFDGATNIATFTPDNSLAALVTYTTVLDVAITDLAGNALASNYTSTFTTADAGWQTAALIETDNAGNASTPKIAIDSSGNALAVWTQSDGVNNNIVSNRYTVSTGWGTPELIETNAGAADGAAIAFDSIGNALAVWYQTDGSKYNIVSNRYVAGVGWGTAELIESDNAGNAFVPQIAFDSNDNALAVWYQSDGTRDNITSNRYVAGVGWGAAELVETDNISHARDPRIAFDNSGNALAVWRQFDGVTDNITANRYVTGIGWGVAEQIETDNAGQATAPQIAFDANGNALAVWRQNNGSRNYTYANRYVAGIGWGAAEAIVTTGTLDSQNPQIAIDSKGNALAVWEEYDTALNIYSSRYLVGTGWSAAESIQTDTTWHGARVVIAFDSNDNALAVWQQGDGTRDNIVSNRYVAGSGWGSEVLIETDNAGYARFPDLAIDSSGNALAVWQQHDGARTNIVSNRFE